jgi:alpha-beta hydrolase superfamily lysophospholipase
MIEFLSFGFGQKLFVGDIIEIRAAFGQRHAPDRVVGYIVRRANRAMCAHKGSDFRMSRLMRWLLRLALRLAVIVVVIIATVMLVRAFDSLRMPDLQAWHTTQFENQYHVADSTQVKTYQDYLQLEDAVFEELEAKVVPAAGKLGVRLVRYNHSSDSWPGSFEQDWNRSYEVGPEKPWGAIVLVHGLTDSPYSMRALAEFYRDQGVHVIAVRMPGHGTAPSGLLDASWQDWLAVVGLAVRYAREKIGPDAPVMVGGYSNGGALVVKYTLDALGDDSLVVPDQIYLFSPAIGITAFAVVANWHRLLSSIPLFEKYKWASILPEYDPFKYNSFPKVAGHQSWALAGAIDAQLQVLAQSGELRRMPPILAFQSLADSTVLTESLVSRLFDRLTVPNSELVIFDINRSGIIKDLISDRYDGLLERIMDDPKPGFTLTVITNKDPDSTEMVARRLLPGGGRLDDRPLDAAWPQGAYSLTHVAIPFSPEDEIYGDRYRRVPNLGATSPRGEKGVLTIPVTMLMRLRHNPFFPYVEERIEDFLEPMQTRASTEP